MKTLFTGADGIPQFINAMEAAQQNSKREKLIIQDKYMQAVALKLLIKLGDYESETRECSKFPDYQQIWTAWKTTFREAFVAKRRAEAAMEGEEKLFSGSAESDAHNQLHQRGATASAVPAPLQNHILDSLEVYLENISTAATQAVAKGGPIAELSASLAILIDTVAAQQK